MSTTQTTTSRRQALALAAALTATILTAVVAIGGLGRGASVRPAAPVLPRVVVQAPATAAPAAPTIPVKWADD